MTGKVAVGVAAGGVATALVCGLFGLAALAGRDAPVASRAAAQAVFIASGRWLLLPWLVTLPITGTLAVIGLIGRVLGAGAELVVGFAIPFGLAWVVAALLGSPMLFLRTVEIERSALRSRAPRLLLVLAAMILWAISAALGAFGFILGFGFGVMLSGDRGF